MRLSDFDYPLDPSLIAQYPLKGRDKARLLVLNRKTGNIQNRYFYNVTEFLRPGDLLVLNDTRVIAARLVARKQKTGGRLNLLLIRPVQQDVWTVLLSDKPQIGQQIVFEDDSTAEIMGGSSQDQFYVKFHRGVSDFYEWLNRVGRTPLPPYIRRGHTNGAQEKEDRKAYQTVFAAFPGSIAAPTAGLHFTQGLLKQIQEMGVQTCTVTLHIGPGTFRPVRVSEVEQHVLDAEFVRIPGETARAVRAAKLSGRRVIAVGTTTVRALESAVDSCGTSRAMEGFTNLFILPGYRFRIVDGLITNFHLPRSTLLMLVSALAGRRLILTAYEEAIRQRYRFYSFGDAMLII